MTVWSRDREVGNWPLGIAIVLWIHDHLGRAACRASVSFVVTFYWLGAKRARGCSAEYLRTVRAYMAERERAGTLPLTRTAAGSIPISTSGTTAPASWRRSSPGAGGSG